MSSSVRSMPIVAPSAKCLQGTRPLVGELEVGSASDGVSVKYISKARTHCTHSVAAKKAHIKDAAKPTYSFCDGSRRVNECTNQWETGDD